MISSFIACSKCSHVIKYNARNGTSNALIHIQKHEKSENESTIDNYFVKQSVTISSTDKQCLIESAVKFVSKDLRPFAAVEGEGLQDFARSLWNMGSKYGCVTKEEISNVIPCRSTVSNQVRKIANTKKIQMSSILSKICTDSPFVAVTCDVWQDNYRRISYLGATIHFYDKGNLCDQILAMKPLDWK